MIGKLFLENYRCFHQHQETRLAPLTFLVGCNSTGKTSFLALIRALWDIAYANQMPDFKEEPYDLGSFDEIAHHRGARGGRSNSFKAGFSTEVKNRNRKRSVKDFSFTFGKKGSYPVLIERKLTLGDTWSEESFDANGDQYVVKVGTLNGSWIGTESDYGTRFQATDRLPLPLPRFTHLRAGRTQGENSFFQPMNGSPDMDHQDVDNLLRLSSFALSRMRGRPVASAPVRSKPRRTYDPARLLADPEGDYIPMFLADIFLNSKNAWEQLKTSLEEFGKVSGLFDEIRIKPLGKSGSEPFQVQIRKFGGKLKGPHRNLRDVGYGVSQILPVITELYQNHAGRFQPLLFLLQQPEVHLHPSAQAALGSLFCQVAAPTRQLVIETHSDYLIDRVRMEVRDGTSNLKSEDVSILFFEQNGLEVEIHSLQIDSEGNILEAPAGYRQFFRKETERFLGL